MGVAEVATAVVAAVGAVLGERLHQRTLTLCECWSLRRYLLRGCVFVMGACWVVVEG